MNQQLEEESDEFVRIELLDLLAEPELLEVEEKLAQRLLVAVHRFFRREIMAGVVGGSEMIQLGQFETSDWDVELRRITGEALRLRVNANGGPK